MFLITLANGQVYLSMDRPRQDAPSLQHPPLNAICLGGLRRLEVAVLHPPELGHYREFTAAGDNEILPAGAVDDDGSNGCGCGG